MKTHSLRIPISSRTNSSSILGFISDLGANSTAPTASGAEEDYVLVPEGTLFERARRLVVLVPDGEMDEREFAMRVGRLGKPGVWKTLFIALACDVERDSFLRRRLATLSAISGSRQSETSSKLVYQHYWLQALEEVLQTGDLVVCLETISVPNRLFSRTSLAEQIVSSLHHAVYVVRGIPVKEAARWREGWRNMLVWLLAFLSMGIFFYLQVQIQESYVGGTAMLLQILSVLGELLILVILSSIG